MNKGCVLHEFHHPQINQYSHCSRCVQGLAVFATESNHVSPQGSNWFNLSCPLQTTKPWQDQSLLIPKELLLVNWLPLCDIQWACQIKFSQAIWIAEMLPHRQRHIRWLMDDPTIGLIINASSTEETGNRNPMNPKGNALIFFKSMAWSLEAGRGYGGSRHCCIACLLAPSPFTSFTWTLGLIIRHWDLVSLNTHLYCRFDSPSARSVALHTQCQPLGKPGGNIFARSACNCQGWLSSK